MKKLIVCCAVFALTGCSTTDFGRERNLPSLTIPENYVSHRGANAETQAEASYRNRQLAAYLIRKSDEDCENYLVGLTASKNIVKSGFNIFGSLLSVIGGTVSDVESANALSGFGGWFASSADKMEAAVFAEKNFNVIYQAIHSGRNIERRNLLQNISKFSTPDISSEEVLAYIVPYHNSCGINYGISEINRAMQTETARASALNAFSDGGGDKDSTKPSEPNGKQNQSEIPAAVQSTGQPVVNNGAQGSASSGNTES